MLLTIDPGEATGWARWCGTVLEACGLGAPFYHPRPVEEVWIEKPVIYPRSKARPNDIIELAVNAGEWGGRYMNAGARVAYVTPAAWKGQVPKETHHVRVWAALTSVEQMTVEDACKGLAPSKRHNVLDAVGLGLWVLRGRR